MDHDELSIEITEDGQIKTTSGKVSASNHQGAEEFLRFIARMTGGPSDRQKRPDALQHHSHSHAATEGQHG